MENTIDEEVEAFMGNISGYDLESQNQILETINRKVLTLRDRQAQDLEHKAMLIRNSSHEMKTKLVYLNHK